MNSFEHRVGGILGSATLRGAIVVVAALVLDAGSATAQDYRGTADQQSACMSDVFRLCSGDIPDVTRIVACLKRERPQLSEGCRAVFGGTSTRVASSRRMRRHHHYSSEPNESDRYGRTGYQGYQTYQGYQGYQGFYQNW